MITFITSLYRSEKHLRKYAARIITFQETLHKKGVSSEYVIIANEPGDEEKAVLSILKDHDSVRIIEIPRESLYASWNRGLREARGEIMGFWNVDDERYPDAAIEGAAAIQEGVELVYFPFIYKRYITLGSLSIPVKTRTIYPPLFDKYRFKHEMHAGPFFMFSKTALEKAGAFDESFEIAGDFDWLSRASDMLSFVKIDAIGGVFHNDGTTLSGSKDARQQEENTRITGKDLLARTFNMPFMDTLHAYEDPEGNIRLYHHLKAKVCIAFLKKNASQEKDFLDAGAGRGQYCMVAKDIYKKVYCFEYDQDELNKAQSSLGRNQNIVFEKVDLARIPLEEKSIDVAVCSEVLEHIKANDIAIKELYRVLKDDGELLLSMPNRFSLFYQKVFMKNRRAWYPKPADGTSDPHFEQRRHLEYPFWKIEKLARSAGFKIIQRQGANIIPLPEALRKKILKHPRLFGLYLKIEKTLSSLLPFCASFYFLTLKK